MRFFSDGTSSFFTHCVAFQSRRSSQAPPHAKRFTSLLVDTWRLTWVSWKEYSKSLLFHELLTCDVENLIQSITECITYKWIDWWIHQWNRPFKFHWRADAIVQLKWKNSNSGHKSPQHFPPLDISIVQQSAHYIIIKMLTLDETIILSDLSHQRNEPVLNAVSSEGIWFRLEIAFCIRNIVASRHRIMQQCCCAARH